MQVIDPKLNDPKLEMKRVAASLFLLPARSFTAGPAPVFS
jgi:hypothetical protein